jgi:hypothetical protein
VPAAGFGLEILQRGRGLGALRDGLRGDDLEMEVGVGVLQGAAEGPEGRRAEHREPDRERDGIPEGGRQPRDQAVEEHHREPEHEGRAESENRLPELAHPVDPPASLAVQGDLGFREIARGVRLALEREAEELCVLPGAPLGRGAHHRLSLSLELDDDDAEAVVLAGEGTG